MSYIAFELDALNVARDVGAAAGISEERITHGLLRMWAWCFREKTDTVESIQVQGFFGCAAAPALVAFGFLEEQSGKYRVRGAERYLRVSEARRKAGASRSSGAGRSAGRFTSKPPANHQQTTSKPPALTPSTEHRAPSTLKTSTAVAVAPFELEPPKAKKTDKPPDPRHAPLIKALAETFAGIKGVTYPFGGGRDAKAISGLLAKADPDAINRAWARALREATHPPIACIYELEPKLAHFIGGPQAGSVRGVAQPGSLATTGPIVTTVSEGF